MSTGTGTGTTGTPVVPPGAAPAARGAGTLRQDLKVRMAFMPLWRRAARLRRRGHRRAGALLDSALRIVCSSDIPSTVDLPPDVLFMHNGLGVVVHPTTTFRGPAVLYHGVTLGDDFRTGEGRHTPVIGSRVVLGAGAIVLGPVTVGDGSIVAAGAVVIHDVPPGSTASGNPATIRPLRDPAVLDRWFVPPA